MANSRTRYAAAAAAALALSLSMPARAHETASVGSMRLTVGWGDEPAFSGMKNSVDVDVVDLHDVPVRDPDGSLTVQVRFGGEHVTLALTPSSSRPGRFTTPLVPTRAGVYAFHVTGTLKGQAIDMISTCSDMTFACVSDIGDIHFPAKDPSAGQLAERISRTAPRAERAMDAASQARIVGLLSAGLAATALAAALLVAGRTRRREA